MPRLFEPGAIKTLHLRNRMAMPAINARLCERGFVSQNLIDFTEARARGGLGLLVAGLANVDPEPCIGEPGETREEYLEKWVDGRTMNIYDDKFVPGLQKLVEAVHRHGCSIGLQLSSVTTSEGGSEGLRRDALYRGGPFRKLETPKRLQEIVEHMAIAAGRAKKAGFDLVEFAASGEALIGQTLSTHPRRNPQVRGYCEGREGRLRFALEIIEQTRDLVGSDYPLGIRMLAHEYLEGGYGLEESTAYAQRFEEAGLDFINVAVGPHSSRVPQLPMIVPPGSFRHLTKAIRDVVSIPIFASVRINNVLLAERILQSGEADFVNLGRPLMADPDLPDKAREGRFQDIVPCIGCTECLGFAYDEGVCCTVNPDCGHERELKISVAPKAKRVMVIGGGPSGMEAARVLRLRGHGVTLYEKQSELGGTLNLASLPPGKQDLSHLVRYLANQLRQLGVIVKCDTPVTPTMIAAEKPDVVILATGATPKVPNIPGLELSGKVVSSTDLLQDNVSVGQKVVIIGGGGIGCETALYLAKQSAMDDDVAMYLATWGAISPHEAIALANKSSRQITVVRRGTVMGEGMARYLRWATIVALKRFGVQMITGCVYKEVNEKGLLIARDGEDILLEADTIVLATGSEPNAQLLQQLQGLAPELYAVGTAKEVKRIFHIINETSRLARQI